MAQQLALGLSTRPALGREDFLVSDCNATALAMIEDTARWSGGRLLLVGPKGSGKTHLAHVWAAQQSAKVIGPGEIGTCLDQAPGSIVIENAERISGISEQEEALFHLYNRISPATGSLLITAEHPPSRWGLKLPDLKSRLLSVQLARLEAPDDALLEALLVKLFSDRQLHPSPRVVSFLASRMERSHAEAVRLVTEMDRLGLELKKGPTLALATQALDNTLD